MKQRKDKSKGNPNQRGNSAPPTLPPALAYLGSELGPPSSGNKTKMTVYGWSELGGQGLILARSATDDWDAVADQIDHVREAMAYRDRPPAAIIAAGGSGALPWEQRSDLQLALSWLDQYRLQWLAAADVNRLSRDAMVGSRLLAELSARDVALHLESSARGNAPAITFVMAKLT